MDDTSSVIWLVAGPVILLSLVGLTKYHSGDRPVANFGLAYEKSPRFAGLLTIFLGVSTWQLYLSMRNGIVRYIIEDGLPGFAVTFGLTGLLFLVLGRGYRKFLNLYPGEADSTWMQLITIQTIFLLSVLAALAQKYHWWS